MTAVSVKYDRKQYIVFLTCILNSPRLLHSLAPHICGLLAPRVVVVFATGIEGLCCGAGYNTIASEAAASEPIRSHVHIGIFTLQRAEHLGIVTKAKPRRADAAATMCRGILCALLEKRVDVR